MRQTIEDLKKEGSHKMSTNEQKALAEQIVNKGIQEVVFKYGAFAPIISSFRIAYTDIVPTMGVDKYARLVVNPEFVIDNEAYIKGLIIHEVLHIFFGHTSDARTKLAYTDDLVRNRIANIAEDCAINQLIEEGLPDGAIFPYNLKKMLNLRTHTKIKSYESAEYYYDLIMEYRDNDTKDNEPGNSGENTDGQPGNNELQNNMCSTDEANTQRVQDELDKMGVEHMSQEEINERTLDTAIQISKSNGNQYGRLAEFAKEMLEPKVDWKPLLVSTIRNAEKKVWTIHSRATYKRTSKRSGQIIMPKKYGHKISVALSFDTSGSVTNEMVSQFLSEAKNCLKYSEIKECALWHTENYWYGTAEQLEKDIEKVFESGGTNSCCIEECARHCKADIGFTFSDGEWGDDPQKPNDCKMSSMIAIIWDGTEITEIRKLW